MLRLPTKSLILFCHQLGVMTEAGVPLRRALATLQRVGRGRLRRVAREIAEDLAAGRTFTEAIDRTGRAFPVLARNLILVGEKTGNLEEVLKGLSDYYEMQRRIIRRMLSKMILPLLQFVFAIAILASVAWIRANLLDQPPRSFLGSPLGILLAGWGLLPGAWLAYLFATRVLGGARPIHEFLLNVPVLRRTMRSFAIGRFSWCMALCMDSAMGVRDAVALSLRATGNRAFAARERPIAEKLASGGTLGEALAETRLFPPEFLEIVSVGEESGKLSESFRRQADNYFEDAGASATALAMVAAGALWVLVAAFIIYQVFLMFSQYLQAISL